MKFKCCFVFLLLACCNINETFLNEEAEREKADLVVNEFYDYYNNYEYSLLDKLFSEKFYEATDKKVFHSLLKKMEQDLGNYESRKILEWKTRRVVGSNSINEYRLIFEVKYQKGILKEDFFMVKEGDNIKIVSYNLDW